MQVIIIVADVAQQSEQGRDPCSLTVRFVKDVFVLFLFSTAASRVARRHFIDKGLRFVNRNIMLACGVSLSGNEIDCRDELQILTFKMLRMTH